MTSENRNFIKCLGSVFVDHSKIKSVIFADGIIRYVCNNCFRSYKYKRGLKEHLTYECGKEPQFICPVDGCTYRCKTKTPFKRHLKRHAKK